MYCFLVLSNFLTNKSEITENKVKCFGFQQLLAKQGLHFCSEVEITFLVLSNVKITKINADKTSLFELESQNIIFFISRNKMFFLLLSTEIVMSELLNIISFSSSVTFISCITGFSLYVDWTGLIVDVLSLLVLYLFIFSVHLRKYSKEMKLCEKLNHIWLVCTTKTNLKMSQIYMK